MGCASMGENIKNISGWLVNQHPVRFYALGLFVGVAELVNRMDSI